MYTREDGLGLRVVEGFRDEVIALRPGRSPRPEWTDSEYDAAAANVLAQAERRIEQFARFGADITGARVLEVGCGSGLYSLALAARPVKCVVGIDLRLLLFEKSEEGGRVRRLARRVLERLGLDTDIEQALRSLPLRLEAVDGRRMSFADRSFDVVWSGACLEHVIPVEPALAEMARVVTPEGLLYHRIDPYFWVRGCHRPGLVDIPWAHARLSLADYERFVSQTEGSAKAAVRTGFLKQLNRIDLRGWRQIVESAPVDIVVWEEEHAQWVVDMLARYPDVQETTVGDVSLPDLTCSLLTTALRRA